MFLNVKMAKPFTTLIYLIQIL